MLPTHRRATRPRKSTRKRNGRAETKPGRARKKNKLAASKGAAKVR